MKRFKVMVYAADGKPKAFFVYAESKKQAREKFEKGRYDNSDIIGVHAA